MSIKPMSQDACCKVGRVAAEYGIQGTAPTDASIDETLLARWKGEKRYREHGYRTLTDWFNRRLLKQAYENQGRLPSERQLEAEYEALTGEDDLAKLELADELAAEGIDADRILDDMVSWSSMRVHITDCLGETKERTATTDWERNSIEIARSQAESKISEAVTSLGSKDEIRGGSSAAVSLDVLVACGTCEATIPLEVALERGYVCETHDASDS